MFKKIMILSLLLLVGCQNEVIYEAGEYIKGDTLPYGFYYTDNPNCTITGYFSETYIKEHMQNGLGHGGFFPLDSFQNDNSTFFIVQYDRLHDDKVTINYGPEYTVEEGAEKFGTCKFKKLKLN